LWRKNIVFFALHRHIFLDAGRRTPIIGLKSLQQPWCRYTNFFWVELMKFKLLALAALVAASGSALADAAPYAKVSSVNGLVTVSAKSQMINAKVGMPLDQGSQIMVSSTGMANIVFANGCSVFLKPGQSMGVSEAECSSINAQRTSEGMASSGAAGGQTAAGLGLTDGQQVGVIVGGTLVVLCLTKTGICTSSKKPTTPVVEVPPVVTPPVVSRPPARPPVISGA